MFVNCKWFYYFSLEQRISLIRHEQHKNDAILEEYFDIKTELERLRREIDVVYKERDDSFSHALQLVNERDKALDDAECAKKERNSFQEAWKRVMEEAKAERAIHENTLKVIYRTGSWLRYLWVLLTCPSIFNLRRTNWTENI